MPSDQPSGGPTGNYSVALPRRFWYPACRSDQLGGREPHAFDFMDTPLVAFRTADGSPAVVVDRCPHRNAPLSLGRVADGRLECGYHGWRFDASGGCVHVPGLEAGGAPADNRSVEAHAAVEADGFIWFWGEPGAEPEGAPRPLPRLTGRRVGRTIFERDLDATLHAALENALDVPHTAFLHGGIFRGRKEPRELTAVRRPIDDGIEVEYLGEPIGFGPLTLRSDQTDRTFDHFDRFLLPSTAQIEYRIEGWVQVVNTILHLPLGPFRTRAWFVLDHESPLPARVVSPIVRWRGQAILRQDIDMLAAQTERIRRFGGERYTSTELDLIGRGIWRLLRQAERAESDGAEAGRPAPADTETTVTIRI